MSDPKKPVGRPRLGGSNMHIRLSDDLRDYIYRFMRDEGLDTEAAALRRIIFEHKLKRSRVN